MDERLRAADCLRFPLQLLITSVRKKPVRLQIALLTKAVHVTYSAYPNRHCFALDLRSNGTPAFPTVSGVAKVGEQIKSQRRFSWPWQDQPDLTPDATSHHQ